MYCSKCGKELSENALFCSGCGNKMNEGNKEQKHLKTIKTADFKKVLNRVKEYFLHFYIDYQSLAFKFAMIIFLAIGIGEPLYILFLNISSFKVWDLFTGASSVFEFLTWVVLFGILTVPILKLKNKGIVKRSNFLRIFWIVSVVLNLIVFIADIELYKYILFPRYATEIIKLLMIISSALLMLKNKQKSPVVLLISALSFAFTKNYVWSIKTSISLYKILETTEGLIDVLDSLSYIFLVLALFLLVYILPRKVSEWLVCIPALAVVVLKIIWLIGSFSFENILLFVTYVAMVVMFVLFALSCSRNIDYDYTIESSKNTRNSYLKVGIVSVSSLLIIVLSYVLVSATVCGAQINAGINRWKDKIVNCELTDDAAWTEMNSDIYKYSCTKFVSQFVDEYSFYETLKDNKDSMKTILECYDAYKNDAVNDDILEEYYYIDVDESWKDNEMHSEYYKKYMNMQPDIDKVEVSAYIDVDEGKIEVTVDNQNIMPITTCTVECDFTILFIESGYSTSTEYGRGSKTIEVGDIGGKSEKTETIDFNPDDYYDSYGSYIMATLFEKNVELISIE